MDRLKDKVCVVTGAGTRGDGVGNGMAAAILFAREGGIVVINDRDADAANRTLQAVEAEGARGSIFLGDLTDASAVQGLIDHAESTWGGVDVLHNNVGMEGAGTVVNSTEELWDTVMTVNVKTMMLTGKFAVPAMERRGGGSIINISSISAVRPRGLTPYTASKGAVNALTQAMAIDHAASGIRVNAIAPGPVYTPHAASGGVMDEERRERRRLASPLGIEGTAWDIGHAAVYFASDESRYVTGVVLLVDGGIAVTSAAR